MIQTLWRFVAQLIQSLLSLLQEIWQRTTAPTIQFDTGRSVRIGKQIAEGGFSFVFEATDCTQRHKKYALKRIHVGDRDGLQACLREAGVHRALPQHHPHLMPLLGLLCQEQTTIYMLFPYMPQSLRSVVNASIFQQDRPMRKPLTELKVLQLIHRIMSGVTAMHEANYSHRDIKLENILMNGNSTPVLMDFGSVGSLEEPLQHRSQLLTMIETASQHTTMPYRPPELLEGGGVRAGDAAMDFTKVDVWSLGCTLFAMCFGASPFECEFRKKKSNSNNNKMIRIVECTQLRILGNPMPPSSMPPTDWYSLPLLDTIRLLLTQDRHARPTLDEAMVEIEALIQKQGGRVPKVVLGKGGSGSVGGVDGGDGSSDLDALLSSNRYV